MELLYPHHIADIKEALPPKEGEKEGGRGVAAEREGEDKSQKKERRDGSGEAGGDFEGKVIRLGKEESGNACESQREEEPEEECGNAKRNGQGPTGLKNPLKMTQNHWICGVVYIKRIT